MASDVLADVAESAQRHREDLERAEKALIVLRTAICGAWNAGFTPEQIAKSSGWSKEQVLEVLAMC